MTYQKSFFEKNEDLVKEVKDGYSIEGVITDEQVIDFAQAIVADKLSPGSQMSNPQAAKKYVRTLIGDYEHEVFGVLFLNTKNKVLKNSVMFTGSLDVCSVHPREIAKAMLKINCGSIILYHCHPSECCDPSMADKNITEVISNICTLLNVKLLDHFIVSRSDSLSFAESGLL